ncbi:MAG: hypothetical protein ACRDP6_35920 [Actinoallomurus sp.]
MLALTGTVVDAHVAYAVDPAVIAQLETVFAYAAPALLGWAVSYLTALLTKSHLASVWKLVINAALTVIAAAVTTVPFMTTGDVVGDLKAYGVALVIAGIANAIAYLKGGSQVLERATWNFGIGRKAAPDAQMGQFAGDEQDQPA